MRASKLREDTCEALDEALETGIPGEISGGVYYLKIIPVEKGATAKISLGAIFSSVIATILCT